MFSITHNLEKLPPLHVYTAQAIMKSQGQRQPRPQTNFLKIVYSRKMRWGGGWVKEAD